MEKIRVKISDILDNQFPEFIREDYPLVMEFFREYYHSQEIPGGPLDILSNIDQYIKLDNITNLVKSCILRDDITFIDTIIKVDSTDGFPDKYGLIRIEDEIITYKSKTKDSFIDCVRGFSGIENVSREKLIFSSTLSADHSKGSDDNPTLVENLSIRFLQEFLNKVKKQFVPGFEERELYKKVSKGNKIEKQVNENLFVKQSSDFYSTKGTDTSFKILFKALYGEDVSIIRPRDYLFEPSNSQYRVTRDLVVEPISGDPSLLLNRTLFQESTSIYPESYGSVTNVEQIFRDGKPYYILSIDYDFDKDINLSGSIFGSFPIHPKTKTTDIIEQGSRTVTVDSTYGFPNSGNVIFNSPDGQEIIINYKSKSLNQFYDCSFSSSSFEPTPIGTDIKLNTYAFSYNNRNKEEDIKVRISGVLERLDIDEENDRLYDIGDTARIVSYGVVDDSPKFKNWIYNIPVTYYIDQVDVKQITVSGPPYTYEIFTKDEHNIYKNEKIEVDFIIEDFDGSNVRTKKIFEAGFGSIPKKSLTIVNNARIIKIFSIRKLIVKINDYDFTANIQNTYKDNNGSLYVASSSLPKYQDIDILVKPRNISFNGFFPKLEEDERAIDERYKGKIITFEDNGILKRHGFITGDAIVYIPGNGDNKLTIPDVGENINTVFFVKKINNNSILLSSSRENLYNENYLTLYGNITGNENKFILYTFAKKNNDQSLTENILGTQKIIRTVNNPIYDNNKYATKPGNVGIFINGVEISNYKSNDVIYSGKIESISVINGGNDYDVINPPILDIINDSKNNNYSKASGIVSVEGSLKEIKVIDGGFGYIEEPKILIKGGGGKGAQAKANLVDYFYELKFNSSLNINEENNSVLISGEHRFYDGERVLYESNNQENIGALISGQYYYISVISKNEFKIYSNYNNAINKTGEPLILLKSNGIHTIKSITKKKVIGSIKILNEGSGYKNNKKLCHSDDVIVRTNTIKIINHRYNSGDIIVYSSSGGLIGGLINNKSYYVTKIDKDNIKLSEIYENDINDPEFLYRTKQYVNLTSSGIGTHEFNYQPIEVSVVGKLEVDPTEGRDFRAKVDSIFRGKVTDITLTNNGSGYGTEDIINYNKQPEYNFISGEGARLKPIVLNGKIEKVLVENSGRGYNSIPQIVVSGDGIGAVLYPIIKNGSISDVKILNGGVNYGNNTKIEVKKTGKDCKLFFQIQTWSINLINRLIFNNQISEDDGILSKSLVEDGFLQYTHAYSPTLLRQIVFCQKTEDDEIKYRTDYDNDNIENQNDLYHSPILGWSYDGCPIYGPYGYEDPSGFGGKIVKMRSGYNAYDDDRIIRKENRPSESIFPLGFFIEDYDFIGSGHLDENNGRFCKTPEFPNGIYAYFLTIDDTDSTSQFFGGKKPIFPYVIGNNYKFTPIDFNFNTKSNQDVIDLSQLNLSRNTLFYNIGSKYSNYEFISDPNRIKDQLTNVSSIKSGTVDNIRVSIAGSDYSVGDSVIFNEENNGKLSANVSSIKGKNVIKIETDSFSSSGTEFISVTNQNQILAVLQAPIGLLNGDKILVNNLNKPVALSDSYTITKIENILRLSRSIGDASETGIITYLEVFGNLDFPQIIEDDIYSIGTEKIKVLSIDKVNNRIKVQREYGNTTSSSYSESSALIENPRKLRFETSNPLNYSSNLNKKIYFNPEESYVLSDGSNLSENDTLFLSLDTYKSGVTVQTGVETILYFNNVSDIGRYRSGYIDIVDSSDISFNDTKKKIVSFGTTSITIDYDTSSYSSTNITCSVRKWNTIDIPKYSIYLPNHNINSGEIIKYSYNSGSSINVFDGQFSYDLEDGDLLYAVKISNDLLGISKTKTSLNSEGSYVGLGTEISLLYFTNYGTGNNHSFITQKSDTLIGNIVYNKARVFTESPHELTIGDEVTLECYPDEETRISILYDDINRRMVSNPKEILSLNVNLTENTIKIDDHNYFTGQRVLYKTSENVLGGLEEDRIYYVYVLDLDTIKLCDSYYNSTSLPERSINFTGIPLSDSCGKLYEINSEYNLIKNNKVIFDLSDPSLSFTDGSDIFSAFEFKLFEDENYFYEYKGKIDDNNTFSIKAYGEIGISNDARVEFNINDIDKEFLYYKLIPRTDLELPEDKKNIVFDNDNIKNNGRLNFRESQYNGTYRILDIESRNSFTISLSKKPESNLYTRNVNYTTKSKSAIGPINKIFVKSNGFDLKKLPSIEGVNSKKGYGSILYPESNTIGKINSYKILDIGFDYSADPSVKPRVKFPTIMKVEPLTSIKTIKVKESGINYILPPYLILIDTFTNKVIDDVILNYELSNNSITILRNTKGIYNKTPKIIPTQNSNGIRIKNLIYDFDTEIVTATLNVYYDSIDDYPFRIGDKIIVEGVKIKDGEGFVGYNSSNHNYDLFEIVDIESLFGRDESIVKYKFSGYGDPGIFDDEYSTGTISLEKFFPKFEIELTKNNFIVGEAIESIPNASVGKVESWDPNNELLKVESSNYFNVGDFVIGKTTGTIGKISSSTYCQATYNVSSSSVVNKGWKLEKGILNSSIQRLHDSDYYQYFSYSVKSKVPISVWEDSVNTLNHTVGFKKFSDLSVESLQDEGQIGIRTDQDNGFLGRIIEITENVNLNCVSDFDLVTENNYESEGTLSSNEIYFNSRYLQDYSESRGNRVLIMDDISGLFTNKKEEEGEDFTDIDKTSSRANKYILLIKDQIITDDIQGTIVNILQDDENVYINQYAKIWSYRELGFFDAMKDGNSAKLQFYPVYYQFNTYDVTFIKFDLNFSEVLEDVFLGDVVKISPNVTQIGDLNNRTILEVPSEYRSSKILVEIEDLNSGTIQYDELTIIKNNNTVYNNQYGNLSNENTLETSGVGLGTYYCYLNNNNILVDFIPTLEDSNINCKVLDISISSSDSSNIEVGSISLNNSLISSKTISIDSTNSTNYNTISSYLNEYNSCYYIVSIEDKTNEVYQISEILVINDNNSAYITEYGMVCTNKDSNIGQFIAIKDGLETKLQFKSNENSDIEIKLFEGSIKSPLRIFGSQSFVE